MVQVASTKPEQASSQSETPSPSESPTSRVSPSQSWSTSSQSSNPPGTDERVAVVAIPRTRRAPGGHRALEPRPPRPEAVAVGVPEGREEGAVLVHHAVAVGVDAGGVAAVEGAGAHPRIAVVAVPGQWAVAHGGEAGGEGLVAPDPVPVLVEVPGAVRRRLVRRRVAVSVHAVTALGRSGEDARVPVVAILTPTGDTEAPVPIVVLADGEGPIAVVVAPVAALGGAGEDLRVCIVAVPVAQHVAVDRRTGDGDASREVAEAVAVAVRDPDDLDHVLVDETIAVVVGSVAELRLGRAQQGLGVVAVVVEDGAAGGTGTGEHAAHRPVSMTVSVRVQEGRPEHSLVDAPVAVLIAPVAGLDGGGSDRRVRVVAVVAADVSVAAGGVRGPVAIGVDHPEGGGIAVLVHALRVADLGVPGEAVRVAVVAVVPAAARRRAAVAVGVRAIVEAAVAGLVAETGAGAFTADAAEARSPRIAALDAVAVEAVAAFVVRDAARRSGVRSGHLPAAPTSAGEQEGRADDPEDCDAPAHAPSSSEGLRAGNSAGRAALSCSTASGAGGSLGDGAGSGTAAGADGVLLRRRVGRCDRRQREHDGAVSQHHAHRRVERHGGGQRDPPEQVRRGRAFHAYLAVDVEDLPGDGLPGGRQVHVVGSAVRASDEAIGIVDGAHRERVAAVEGTAGIGDGPPAPMQVEVEGRTLHIERDRALRRCGEDAEEPEVELVEKWSRPRAAPRGAGPARQR